jgi:hypothetical protein
MKVRYISHACLYCEAGEDRILFDPWYGSPAYLNQWHVHPQPADDTVLQDCNVILISHGHEDHLHFETLNRCNKAAKVYYPYQPSPGSREFISGELGFPNFVEASGNRTYTLPGGTKLTLFPVGHDCAFVIDDGRHVLVNVNDALHACSADLIAEVCQSITRRFPKIDYVFGGFGGASYFPNCFHRASKSDSGIAFLREAVFARNFCYFSHLLRPRFAIPFAADFLLKHASLKWINDYRFDRGQMADMFAALFPESGSATTVLAIEPGQGISEDGAVIGGRESGPDLAFAESLPTKRDHEAIVRDYRALISGNLATVDFPTDALPFAIEVKSPDRSAWIVLSEAGNQTTVELSAERPAKPAVTALIGIESVEYLLELDWQSDVIVIGYGMEFWIDDEISVTDKLVHALGDVVTHYPKSKDSLRKTPLRFFRWVVNNHLARHLLRRRLGLASSSVQFSDAPMSDWLNHEPEALASKLGIPAAFVKPRSAPADQDRPVELAERAGDLVA